MRHDGNHLMFTPLWGPNSRDCRSNISSVLQYQSDYNGVDILLKSQHVNVKRERSIDMEDLQDAMDKIWVDWVTVCKTIRPMLSDRCLSVCPVCDVRALWPNGWTDQDKTWHTGRPRPWPHCVRWRPSPLPKKGAEPPNFRPMFIVAKRLDGSRCHLSQR